MLRELHGDAGALHDFQMTDARFKSVSEEYHGLNREIHRIEAEFEQGSDPRLEVLKKQRRAMLDDVVLIVNPARAAA